MKKIVLAAAMSLLFAGNAMAVSQSNTGCGLGHMIFKDAPDNILFEILAVTTNGTFGNQTFGITSGTLDCRQPGKVVKNERLNHFVKANMDGIARDIAQGRGENLDTFMELMQVPQEKRAEYTAALQRNFAGIYASENVAMADVIDGAAQVAAN